MIAGDDSELAAAARAGDRAAFGRLYERYARLVHTVALAHGPAGEARDLVHDVFACALAEVSRLREAAAFPSWLAAIARRRAIDRARAASESRASAPGAAERDRSALTPIDELEAHRALEAIRALPEAYRETLALRLVEGMTGPEIAALTGLAEGSVRVNLHRGMKLLREALGGGDR